MSDRFVEIAAELRELYLAQIGGASLDAEINSKIRSRQVMMVPENGWPGSNAEARKVAAAQAEETDKVLQSLRKRLDYCEEKRSSIAAQIESLRAERRGLEWQIRRAMVMQMAIQSGVAVEFDGVYDDTHAFEAWVDKNISRELFEMPEEPEPEEPEESPQADDLPPVAHDAFDQHVALRGNPRPNPFIDVPTEETFQELERRLEAEKQAAAADPVQDEIPF